MNFKVFSPLVAGLVVLAAAACGGSDSEPVATPTPTPVPATATPVPEPVVDVGGSTEPIEISEAQLAEIRAALAGVLENESFHFALEASIQASVAGISLDIPVTADGDFEPPDRSQATLSINMGFVSFEIKTVTADGAAFATDPQTGDWVRSESTDLLSSPHEAIGLVLGVADLLEVVGRESIGDAPVLHLRAADALGVLSDDSEGTATVDVWIGADDFRPVRISLEGEISLSDLGDQFPAQIGSGPAKFASTITLSEYGAPVVIDVPNVEATLVDGRLPGRKVEAQIDLVIDFAESHPAYKSTPATSGWHYGPPNAPAAWGVHNNFVSDEVLLQNLVQGGVGLHYNCPDGCPEVVAAFTKLAGQYNKIVVSPYGGMDFKIAITAWTFIDEMDELDLPRVEIFVRAHHNSERAPEYYKP